MKTSLFSFSIPEELIAQKPAAERDGGRLLVLDRETDTTTDSHVRALPRWIERGTLVVLNDSRVRKARLFGESAGGGKVEVLLLARMQPGLWAAMTDRMRKLTLGKRLRFPEGVVAEIVGGEGDTRLMRFAPPIDEAYLERHGRVPLPPYIKRPDTYEDAERYQTVFSRTVGSAAAPTAGLHFTPGLIEELEKKGIETAFVTLHVGLGTFLPIRAENLEDHVMHEESYSIPHGTKMSVEKAAAEGRPILAVGTTVVRTLESAWRDGGLEEGDGRTKIFIYPGYRFRVVSRLFTNFHTPGSSLLALVSAFAGRERVLKAYARAVEERYRFFSYGDAMLIR